MTKRIVVALIGLLALSACNSHHQVEDVPSIKPAGCHDVKTVIDSGQATRYDLRWYSTFC